MIKIRCSALEQVRNNPTLYVQSLLEGSYIGGSYGMFSYWQNTCKAMHQEDLSISDAILRLQQQFIRFNDSKNNRAKQEKLIKNLIAYDKEFKKHKFEFEEGVHRMTWKLHNDVTLTGNTPWIVKNENGFFSFLVTEKEFAWNKELRFPLLQDYLANQILKCGDNQLTIGIYTLHSDKFEFIKYNSSEIKNAVMETKKIFKKVSEEYSNRKI